MELTESKPNVHIPICATLWQCLGHSEMGIQLGSTDRLTSETVLFLVYR